MFLSQQRRKKGDQGAGHARIYSWGTAPFRSRLPLSLRHAHAYTRSRVHMCARITILRRKDFATPVALAYACTCLRDYKLEMGVAPWRPSLHLLYLVVCRTELDSGSEPTNSGESREWGGKEGEEKKGKREKESVTGHS